MSVKTAIAKLLARQRVAQIHRMAAEPEAHQRQLLARHLERAALTQFGQAYGFGAFRDYETYRQRVPLREYEAFQPYIDRAYAGQPDVLWPGRPLYFAKTSGTTSGAKHIPLTREMMQAQVRGAKDALLCYIYHTGNAHFLDGKMIFLSGSPALERNVAGIPVGRLSGIAQHFVPAYLQRNRVPTFDTNCIEDWEAKLAAIIRETRSQDLRLISGIPPWVQMFYERVEAETGKKPAELWPKLDVFVQGGVDYTPYRPLIQAAFGRLQDTVETYPASEGFIAIQEDPSVDALLLMLDYGIFFEFVPLAEYYHENPRRLPLWEVQLGEQYAIVLTTNAGLWSYVIGDVVKFVSTAPYRLKVTGRVKHFLSAFGEHVIEEEVSAALQYAVQAAGGQVAEYTVAPYVAEQGSRHEWYIEFSQRPASLDAFAQRLDEKMRQQNPYYEDLRAGHMLAPAAVYVLPDGACRAYMKQQGKLGGQNKFPKLKNDRSVADALRLMLSV
ncbi:MAG: GH3 auxin-responsive promoter family protein [Bacteroidetes bacterium]|jgi:hypothetical protein|nr:GH3 auxin-responsive promoter family protein [Bacteroidota bacterium]